MLLEVDIYDSSHGVAVEGVTYPARCLVEDRDGIRILLVPNGDPILKSLWSRAHESGAQAILRTDTLAYILLEHFVSDRRPYGIPNSATEAFQIPTTSWHRCVWMPDYVEMVNGSADAPPEGFVHLHTHTEHSGLDGLSTVDELLEQVLADGQTAVAVTDHGICACHPELQLAAQKKGIKPIFGMEAYFVDDRHNREGDPYGYWHLILWAMDDEGLLNLWAMSTESYRDGLWQKPRIDWDTLERLNKGVMASTACLGGPLLEPWGRGDVDRAMANLGRLQAIFGDRLYIELGTTQEPQQLPGNRWLVGVAQAHRIPMVAVVDSHYPAPEDKFAHRTWLGVATHGELTEDSKLFAGGHDYHVMTEREVRFSLAYLPDDVVDEAVRNTGRVAARCTATLVGKSHNPIYSRATEDHPDRLRHDEERLFDLCMKRWDERTRGKSYSQEVAFARFEREMHLIVKKEYCGYYLMEWDMVIYAKEHGVLVGPGRGSGGGSLVAYVIGITELDPIENDLLFERFMTEGRTALPDFDIDYPSNKKQFMLEYVSQRWGADHVAIVGTHTRLQNKGAINDTARAMESALPEDIFTDLKQVSALIDAAEASTAGLGLSWEELWSEHGEVLEPFRERHPELFAMATKLRGRLRTYSKHAAGVIIDPDEPLTGMLPLRGDGEGYMVTQFGKDVLEELGYVKFDMLNIRTLDTIQHAVDLIRAQRGHQVVPYKWREEYEDPFVWGEISEGWTLGIFQIETTAGTRLAKRFRPNTIAELADVITLVRPGPTRSGLTDQYFRRREGDEEITHLDDRMRALLGRTQGCMLYQEDILAVCMTIAGYGSDEADGVRKILGKKQVEKVEEAGRKFRQRSIANDTTEEAATLMWDQMAEFAKYCVSGDTHIWLAASGPNSDGTVTAQELYRRLHSQFPAYANAGTSLGAVGRPASTFTGPCVCCGQYAKKYLRGHCQNKCLAWLQKFHYRGLYALSYYADGRIRPARILDVVESGEQELFRMTLASGRTLDATARHRHLTPDGYRMVEDLRIGDGVIIDGGYQEPTPDEVRSRTRLTVGERQLVGAVDEAFGSANYGYIDGGAAVWKQWRQDNPRICHQCGSSENVQLAHLDGNHQHNETDNFAWLCQPCHLKYDYVINDRRKRWQKGHLAIEDRIISIESVGTQMTYDVVMDAPHNFVANGIVTHNSFGKAHATAYAIIGYWTAWLKFHYPVEFLCAALSTIKQERIPEFVGEARRMGYRVLPPDINESGKGFTATQMTVRYGLMSVKSIGEASSDAILSAQPYTSWEDFLARRGKACNMGHVKTLVRIGAFDTLLPNRRGLEQWIEDQALPAAQRCQFRADALNEHGLPCGYDWESEPVELGRSGKPKKGKPVPKKCTAACRRFTPREPLDARGITPYTEADIRRIEMDFLGVFLSSTPFDRIPPEDRASLATAVDVLTGPTGAYLVAALVKNVRKRTDRTNRAYAFLGLTTEMGEMECIVFASKWEKFGADMHPGDLAFVGLTKNSRGQALDMFYSLES